MSSKYERRTGSRQLVDFEKLKETLSKNRFLWIAPMVAFTVVGTLHALTKQDSWKASQALVVRDEAIGELGFGGRIGRFDSNDTLKRSLETILQIAKNRNVARAALSEVGPEGKRRDFPSDKDIESLIGDISVSAPKGTEFGTSEVIYLAVTAAEPERAVALADAVCDQLEWRLQLLRNEHAQSIIAELREQKDLADRELNAVTIELSKLEQSLGPDLGEMRTLAESGSAGESNIRSQLNQIKVELRQVESVREAQSELLHLLGQINGEPDAILATPNQLLNSQPTLRRLKEGLVEAQLRTAHLRAGFTNGHPKVQAAFLNEQNVMTQLQLEIKNAVRSTQNDIAVNDRLVMSLKHKLKDVSSRLENLAAQRAGYVNLTSKVSQRREQLRQASIALAEARGRQEAAKTSSLISRLDTPVTGSRPVGPGRLTLIFGSAVGGLLLGLSLVYLLAPWQEIQRAGRRKTDQLTRRLADATDSSDRRARPTRPLLQYQSLPEAVTSLPGNGTTVSSLQHLSHIAEYNQ